MPTVTTPLVITVSSLVTLDSSLYLDVTTTHAVYAGASVSPTLQTAATIAASGVASVGVYFDGSGTVINTGRITSAQNDGVRIAAGGSVYNATSALISGSSDALYFGGPTSSGVSTVTNAGTLLGGRYGAVLPFGGTVANLSGGLVSSSQGTALYVTDGTITNAGRISSAVGSTNGPAVVMNYGFVDNLAGGTITAVSTNGVRIRTSTGTITNAGTISNLSTSVAAVYLSHGGSVSNLAGGVITGPQGGVLVAGGGTVTNAGTIAATGTAAARSAVYFVGAAGTVFNTGQIVASGMTSSRGVALFAGGYLSNAATGTISATGNGNAVRVQAAAGTIVNAGTLTNNFVGRSALALEAGGRVSNAAGGVIEAGAWNGIYGIGGAVTIINAGTITGDGGGATHNAIQLFAGGVITNAVGGTISAPLETAIYVKGAAGTVVNAGIISSGTSGAVSFAAGFANRVIDLPGAAFIGAVDGGNTVGATAVSTLELAFGAGIGTVSGLGAQFIDFVQTTIDVSASWEMLGANLIASGETLTNAGTLKLLGASLTDDGVLLNNGIISIDPSTLTAAGITGSGTIDIGSDSTLTVSGPVSIGEAIVFTGTNGVLNILDSSGFAGSILGQGPTDQVNISCFTEGTRISTERGAVVVEELRNGDRIPVVMGGKVLPVIWLGHRHVDCRRHPRPTEVWPICLEKGAFGPRRPFRDLWLSPDHALFIGGVLIPIRYLVNGRTIYQQARDEVTYWHVELATHNVLYAEGVPVESYLDTGSRSAFVNRGAALDLHPDFSRTVWEAQGCAPLVVHGERLTEAQRYLLVRATALDHATTRRARLAVVANGKQERGKVRVG